MNDFKVGDLYLAPPKCVLSYKSGWFYLKEETILLILSNKSKKSLGINVFDGENVAYYSFIDCNLPLKKLC